MCMSVCIWFYEYMLDSRVERSSLECQAIAFNHWYLHVQLKFTKWYKFKLTFSTDSNRSIYTYICNVKFDFGQSARLRCSSLVRTLESNVSTTFSKWSMLHFVDKTPSSSLFSCLIYVSLVDLLPPKNLLCPIILNIQCFADVFFLFRNSPNKSNLVIQIDKSLVENLHEIYIMRTRKYSNLNWIQFERQYRYSSRLKEVAQRTV